MKRLLLLAATAAVTLGATAAVPFEKGRPGSTPVRHAAPRHTPVMKASEKQTLINEDFSRFTEGSETAPAENEVCPTSYMIPDEFTAQPGWRGRGLHSAGGAVAVMKYEYTNPYYPEDGPEILKGYISTPGMMLNGTTTVTVRARSLGEEGAALWLAACDDYYGPGEDADFTLTPEWQTFTLETKETSLEEYTYFQFSIEEGVGIIDDIRVDFSMDRIPTPYALNAVNLTPNSFIASWEEVPGAEAYLLNMKRVEAVADPVSAEVVQTFDGIRTGADGNIDTASPGYPEGWTIDVSSNGTQDTGTDEGYYSSGPRSLKFDAVGDMFETETFPYPIDAFSFWVRTSPGTDDDYSYLSLFRIELYHSNTGTWDTMAQIPQFYLEDPDGCVYTLNGQALGKDVTKVRISFLQRGKVDFYFDDIRVHYTQRGNESFAYRDHRVEGTEFVVSGINPADEYSYYVQAVLGDIVSAPSHEIWVDGIAGLAVETEEPSDITPTSFTASWKQLGHATNYKVDGFRLFEPKTDAKDVLVIEENFDGIDEGTLASPGMDWTSPFDFSSRGWTTTGWGATNPSWIAGMAGTTGTSWTGTAGLVFTPALDLSCHDGASAVHVEGTFLTTTDSFTNYNGENESEGIFALIMKSPSETTPLASGYLDAPVKGTVSGSLDIANIVPGTDLSSVIIAFMNKSGLPFYVDNVRITMDVPAGKTLMTPFTVINTPDTSCRFENLDPTVDHAFTVTASASHNFEAFVSTPSEVRRVNTSTSGVENVAADAAAEVTTAPGMICIAAPEGMPYTVHTLAGHTVAAGSGTADIQTAPGIYVVALHGTAVKVIVR